MDLGWAPALSFSSAIGVLLVSLAYQRARDDLWGGAELRWAGLLVLFIPIAWLLSRQDVERKERIAAVLLLGVSLYLVKVMYSPLEFKFSDELQHLRTTLDILETGHFFSTNTILPVSPFYPGLQGLTVAVMYLTDLPAFGAGLIVIGLIRVLLLLSLFLLFEQITRSVYAAGIAALVYMTNPHFLFFNSYFVYQSLAVPLVVFAWYLAIRCTTQRGAGRIWMKLVLLATVPAIAVTHHISAYALVVIFGLWSAVTTALNFWKPRAIAPVWTATFAAVVVASWVVFVAKVSIPYLSAPLSRATNQFLSIITRDSTVEQVFRPPETPLPELLISFIGFGLIAFGILFTAFLLRRRRESDPLMLTALVGSFGFFASFMIRLASADGAELAGRSWPFLYIFIGPVVAIAAVELSRWRLRQPWRTMHAVTPALLTIVFVGGSVQGWPPIWARLPGPFLVEASERSIEPEGKALAEWSQDVLQSGNRIASNLTNYILLGSLGNQQPVFDMESIFLSSSLGQDERRLLEDGRVRFLAVDRRLSTSRPVRGFYFEPWEPLRGKYDAPIPIESLTKFDRHPAVDRIYDSGDIVVYDVRGVWR